MKFNKCIAALLVIVMLHMSVPSSVFADNKAMLSANTVETSQNIEFPQIGFDELKSEMHKAISNGHPYIIANEDNINKIKEYAFGKDEVLTAQYSKIKSKADKLLKSGVKKIKVDTSSESYIGTAIDAWNNTMILALAYHVENDDRYAQKAYEQSEYFCNLTTWGTYQMIDNVQTAFCVAICYDWLYDWLSTEQKEVLVNGLRNLHLNMVSDVFKNPNAEKYKWSFHQSLFNSNNHGLMDCSLSFLSAMAIADTDIDFMVDIMQKTLNQLSVPFANWYPDSGWYEGVGYWEYAGPYTTRLLMAMQSAFGHCFGYDEFDCLLNVADFPIYASSDEGAFILGDIYLSTDAVSSPIIYSMGKLKGDIGLQNFALKECDVTTTADAVFALHYDPHTDYSDELELSLDKLFRNIDVVTMRNTFEGSQSTWCAMGVRKIRPSGMMNVGSVGFDALGERWIMNHGREKYYPGYFGMTGRRWQYYRTRTESQSCIVIDPSEFGGQNIDAVDNVDTFVSGSGSSYAIADLTETYSGQVDSYKRGIMLADGRKTFVVQDEISMPKPSELYSFFNIYDSDVVIGANKKTATISKGYKKMYVTVDCDSDYTFGVMACEPLPTSPVPENPNSPNKDFQKLYIHFDNEEDVNIRVTFTPYLCDEELNNISVSKFVPMAQWSVDNSEINPPLLTDIKINGTSVSDFNSFNRCYEVTDVEYPANITVDTDSNLYDVAIKQNEEFSMYDIIVSEKQNPANINTYSVAFAYNTQIANPVSTYTNSEFKGVMLPQENYRIGRNDFLSAMYFKDEAPEGSVKAILSINAKVVGEKFDTLMGLYSLDSDVDLKYISGANAPVDENTDIVKSISALNAESINGGGVQRLEFDITSLLPSNGGDFVFALLPVYQDENYLTVASHRNSSVQLQPQIKYIRIASH